MNVFEILNNEIFDELTEKEYDDVYDRLLWQDVIYIEAWKKLRDERRKTSDINEQKKIYEAEKRMIERSSRVKTVMHLLRKKQYEKFRKEL